MGRERTASGEDAARDAAGQVTRYAGASDSAVPDSFDPYGRPRNPAALSLAACVARRKPLVSGAAIGFDGQVSVYDSRQPEAPCYACLFPPEAAFEEARCATMGGFAPLVGIIGTVQAAEALKLLTGVGTSLAGRLQMLDARQMAWTEIRMARQPDCAVCAPLSPR